MFVVIGWGDYFGFGFTTLILKKIVGYEVITIRLACVALYPMCARGIVK